MEISNDHHQVMASNGAMEMLNCSKTHQEQEQQEQQQDKRLLKPQPEQSLKCPRCDSTNTKFCYYNNYSLSQPRYFCKGCRRYWTKGGSLRNVPVGGGCRKNKRSNSSSKKSQEQEFNSNPALPLPPISYEPSDLTLAFANLHSQPNIDNNGTTFLLTNPNPNTSTTTTFLDFLRSAPSGFQNQYYGFGGNSSVEEGAMNMFPFDEGLLGSSTEAVTTTVTPTNQGSCQWPVLGDHTNLAMDSGRDYWNGVGSSWHGLINSSLM